MYNTRLGKSLTTRVNSIQSMVAIFFLHFYLATMIRDNEIESEGCYRSRIRVLETRRNDNAGGPGYHLTVRLQVWSPPASVS